MKNIFKKQTEEVIVEGAEAAIEETVAEVGEKFNWKKTVIGGLIVTAGIAIGSLVLSAISNKDEAELRVPDTDEPIEVTDDMLNEVVAE